MMPDVSLFRLYLMRALYLMMLVGQGLIQAPAILAHGTVLPFWHGIGSSLLLAMALMAGLGIRYPLRMVPLLLFELLWKGTWLAAVALPQWLSHSLDPATVENAPSILAGVIVPFVIPWRYVFANYLTQHGDRWK